jgi:transcriptional regulator with XRE-family HTH domain
MTGEQLKRLRTQLGLSIAASARVVEVTPRTWARWESGERAIPRGAVKLFYMANGLGDPPND